MTKCIDVAGKCLDLTRPVVMGILNVTPDSFYDGGCYLSETKIIARIRQIAEEGAGIIDVGACSTRPGAAHVDEKEEIARLTIAVELIRKYYPDMFVSIDTFRSEVAKEINTCLGPVVVNDISGGTMDERMFDYIAESGTPYIMMHIQGTPQTMQLQPVYREVVEDVRDFYVERLARIKQLGATRIVIDPGFGFGKNQMHNYRLLNRLEVFKELGYPLLVGISRKSMIYKLLGTTPAEALNGTTVLNTIALLKGANILRVHDVKEAVETIKIVESFNNGELKIENECNI